MDAVGVSLMPRRKMNGPGQRASSAVTTAVQQTPDPPEDITQGDAWREDIGQFPKREVLAARIQDAGERRANQAAVEDQTSVLHHEDFIKRFVGELFLPIGGDVEGSRAQDRADDEPRA